MRFLKGILRQKKLSALGDESLLVEFRENPNEYIITEFFNRYGYLVYGVCLKYAKTKEDAEDLTLQIFSNLNQKIAKHQITHFRSWLFTVARNESLMSIRKIKIKSNSNYSTLDLASVTPDSTDDKDLMLDLLPLFMQKLQVQQKQCIERFYLNGDSYQQISDGLGLSLNEVKSHIQNGKRKLKIYLSEVKRQNEQ